MTPDSELLRRYAKTNSEDAFAELVQRHVNLVYSAALRQVGGDAHLARDVAQTVFIALARKARPLSRRATLTGWLYTSAHFAAAKIVRTENRRRDREEQFMREPIHESSAGVPPANMSDDDWEKIRPPLDDVMHELKASDREAILLRYFENRPFAGVGVRLGLNENAARMRVERALEKLRAIFAQRGITTVAALASVISANAVQVAPAGLATTLAAGSVAAAGTGTAFTLLKFMTATHIKLGIGALIVAGAATAMVVQHQAQNKLRADNEALQQQLAQFKTDDANLSNRLASVGDAKKLSDDQFNELLRLRGEVGLVNERTNRLARELAGLKAENRDLRFEMKNMQKQALENFPVLTNVLAFREHMIAMVNAGKLIGLAMRESANNHSGDYPTNLEQIKYSGYLPGGTNFTTFPGNLSLGPEQNDSAFDLTNLPAIGLNDFEMVNAGQASEQFPQMPMLKQRLPLWWDGKWQRIYILADGSAQWITSDNEDFSAWEKKQLALSLGKTNQNQ
jgi:RNA polymerase sigma factor (sigma-70 family)